MIIINDKISCIDYAVKLLNEQHRTAILKIPANQKNQIQEIRLRKRKYLSVTIADKEYFLTIDGQLKNNALNTITVNDNDIDITYNNALEYSVHSYQKEICQGYITCEGGNRVGFCGYAINKENSNDIYTLKDISSINIRIAREIIGCSKNIYDKIFSEKLSSLIIAGAPSSGKTTILRDLCRMLGQKYRISIIDERNEIAAKNKGISYNNVGLKSDIFTSYSKYYGILTAIRVMSPQAIVCDEIGAKSEIKAFEYALNSGVKLIVSCHASSFDELKKRPVISKLLKDNAFEYAVILGRGSQCGKITEFYRLDDYNA